MFSAYLFIYLFALPTILKGPQFNDQQTQHESETCLGSFEFCPLGEYCRCSTNR